MNKFSIASIDLIKLDKEIIKLEAINSKKVYVFMNKKTADAITFEIDVKNFFGKLPHSGVICKYKGNKVFIDNELDFGEIELR